MNRDKLAAEIQDDNGNTRGYLESMGRGWHHVYSASGEYLGAGMTLKSAIEMVTEKSGMDYEALPPVSRADLIFKKGEPNKIVGFQGGGFYRFDTVSLGNKLLGTFQIKQQPARRRYESHTSAANGYCVLGHDLDWMCRANGLRLVD